MRWKAGIPHPTKRNCHGANDAKDPFRHCLRRRPCRRRHSLRRRYLDLPTAPKTAAANATTVVVTGQKPGPNAQVCEYQAHEGSMIKTRVCMTQAEADARRHYTQDQITNYQVRQLSLPMAK